MPTDRFTFPGQVGPRLTARLDRPEGPHLATCADGALLYLRQGYRRRAPHLGAAGGHGHRGAGVFDFTGLGHSEGELSHLLHLERRGSARRRTGPQPSGEWREPSDWAFAGGRRRAAGRAEQIDGYQGRGHHRRGLRPGACAAQLPTARSNHRHKSARRRSHLWTRKITIGRAFIEVCAGRPESNGRWLANEAGSADPARAPRRAIVGNRQRHADFHARATAKSSSTPPKMPTT